MIDTSGNEYEYTATSGQTTPGTTGPVVNPISQNPASIGTVPAGTTISQLS